MAVAARGGIFLFALALAASVSAQIPRRAPVTFDAALGADLADPLALTLLLASPEVELRGVSVAGSQSETRALFACRFLTMTGRRQIAASAGAAPQPELPFPKFGQYRYYYHPDVLFNRTTRPAKEPAHEFLAQRVLGQPGIVTLVAAGPLTNVARMLAEKPATKEALKRIVVREQSLAADSAAARAVLDSGAAVVLVPQGAVAGLELSADDRARIFAPRTALSLQLENLFELSDGTAADLGDALAASLAIDDRFCTLAPRRATLDAEGRLTLADGPANVQAVAAVRREEFRRWFVERLAGCVSPTERPVAFVPAAGWPHRVHVAEDYELDIERFWWMAGKEERTILPPGSRRACRGTLTHDYDDLLGNAKAMHRAVVFNPVPGPPMGQRPRLRFRYWLQGTDRLRVQIYSLTNGYHRQLYLTGLPQGRWESGTVDMTQARRPDGTGGPLAEGERIDDIQFYIEPGGELLIDDVTLYDAAADGERRPFPKRVFFSGWFDSGKQGKEWPGTFEIVEEGFFWKAAHSVADPERKAPWIRLHLRGERPLSATTEVSFRYKLAGADRLEADLLHAATGKSHRLAFDKLKTGIWAEAQGRFTGLADGVLADELRFLLPPGAELWLDDVLLYEPGR